jgi:hypothetical protein
MKRLTMAIALPLCFNGFFSPPRAQDVDTVVTNVMNFLQLQTALDLAESNQNADYITIGEGTLSLAGLDQHFAYNPPYRPLPEMEEHYPLTISGAGPDKTILDGDGGSILWIATGDMSADFGANIEISGICFRNVTDPLGSALGIATKAASIRVYDCKFVNCRGADGSGLYATTGGVELPGYIYVGKCTVDSCSGAMNIGTQSAVTVENCTFTNNTGDPALACVSTNGAHTIKKCTFTNNSTTRSAPLTSTILNLGEIILSRNTFIGNNGTDAGAVLIDAVNSKITIFRNEFRGNEGNTGGALYCSNNGEGTMTLFRNVFAANRAHAHGGGAYLFSGKDIGTNVNDSESQIVVQSCLFARNRATFGSSLHVRADKAVTELLNCTFAYDSVNNKGGGILSLFLCNNAASASLMNNLFWGNVTKNGPLWSLVTTEAVIDNDHQDLRSVDTADGTGAEVTISHNVLHRGSVTIDSAASRDHPFDVDPLIDDSCRLTPGSPAIDAGSPAAHAIADPGKDCGGNERSIDGDEDGKAVVDIGAFEFDPDNLFIADRPERRYAGIARDANGAGQARWYDLSGRRLPVRDRQSALPAGVYIIHHTADHSSTCLLPGRRSR